MLSDLDGLRQTDFFKGKQQAIIYDDLDWKDENMTKKGILHLLIGEVTIRRQYQIFKGIVLVPREIYGVLTSNYSLHNMHNLKIRNNKQRVQLFLLTED